MLTRAGLDDRIECVGDASTLLTRKRKALLLLHGKDFGVSQGRGRSRRLWHGLLGLVDDDAGEAEVDPTAIS